MIVRKHCYYKKTFPDKYFGKKLLCPVQCSHDQFRIKDYYLVRNEDGMLGFVGEGVQALLSYVTDTGPWAFNSVEEDRLVWLPHHQGYCKKGDEEHFQFPFIVGEFYKLKDGIKTIEWHGEVPKINYPKFGEWAKKPKQKQE